MQQTVILMALMAAAGLAKLRSGGLSSVMWTRAETTSVAKTKIVSQKNKTVYIYIYYATEGVLIKKCGTCGNL